MTDFARDKTLTEVAEALEQHAATALQHDNHSTAAQLSAAAALYRCADALHQICDAITSRDAPDPMTPLQQQLGHAISEVATDIRSHFERSHVPPDVWLGIIGCVANIALDAVPQDTRSEIATAFCDCVMTNVRDGPRFDA